jgi:hypothetical protein
MAAIANFSLPTALDPSLRDAPRNLLLPPFFQLRSIPKMPFFDAGLAAKTASEATSPRNILALSRPLFWRDTADLYTLAWVMRVAMIKLAFVADCSTIISALMGPGGDATALALFFGRIQLGISTTTQINNELVRSRMALCQDISSDRARMRVGYVSEPTTAEAACRFWSMAGVLSAILDHLLTYTRYANMCSQGPIGEMVAMTILCLAWNKTCEKQDSARGDHLQPSTDSLPFSRTVTVCAYLDALLGKGEYPPIDASLAQCLLYFTHFCKIYYTPSRAGILNFFRRGAAIICMTGELGIDLIIPAIAPGRDNNYALTPENCTYILVQVKNQKASGKPAGTIAANMIPGKFCRLEPTSHFHIALIMSLGLPTVRQNVVPITRPHEDDSKATASRRKTALPRQNVIHVRGMSPAVYPCITEDLYNRLSSLLDAFALAPSQIQTRYGHKFNDALYMQYFDTENCMEDEAPFSSHDAKSRMTMRKLNK